MFWFAVSAVPWLAGALVSGPARGVLWTTALAIDYGAAWLRHPTPVIGRLPTPDYAVAADHLAERYQQIFTLALGDLILVITLTYAAHDLTIDRTAALLVGFAAAVLLWQIYVHRAGALLESRHRGIPGPGQVRAVRAQHPPTHGCRHRGRLRGLRSRHRPPRREGVAVVGRRPSRRARAVPARTRQVRVRGVQPASSPSRLVALLVLAVAGSRS